MVLFEWVRLGMALIFLSFSTCILISDCRQISLVYNGWYGPNRSRNGMDLTEAEDTKRWQEYTEELHKTDLYDPDNHSGVITHLDSSWNVKSSGP